MNTFEQYLQEQIEKTAKESLDALEANDIVEHLHKETELNTLLRVNKKYISILEGG